MNSTNPNRCSVGNKCRNGIIIPWLPGDDNSGWIRFYKAIVYGGFLVYLMFGISILTNRIIGCCEVIASQKRKAKIKLKSGATAEIKVHLWHPTVAALTIGVVGTSAPELLIPLIEIFYSGFEGDELGPSLIVGSGAYHLLLITAICLLSVKDNYPKPIKDLQTFFITATFAVIAYLWVYIILGQISPGVIELWEAIVTLILFPILVFVAWSASKRYYRKIFRHICHFGKKSNLPNQQQNAIKRSATAAFTNGSQNVVLRQPSNAISLDDVIVNDNTSDVQQEPADDDDAFDENNPDEQRRKQLIHIMRRLRKEHPGKSVTELEGIVPLKYD